MVQLTVELINGEVFKLVPQGWQYELGYLDSFPVRLACVFNDLTVVVLDLLEQQAAALSIWGVVVNEGYQCSAK